MEEVGVEGVAEREEGAERKEPKEVVVERVWEKRVRD